MRVAKEIKRPYKGGYGKREEEEGEKTRIKFRGAQQAASYFNSSSPCVKEDPWAYYTHSDLSASRVHPIQSVINRDRRVLSFSGML